MRKYQIRRPAVKKLPITGKKIGLGTTIFRRRKSRQPKDESFTGVIAITASGLGFVTPEKSEMKDIFIPPQFIGGAMHGDTVRVVMLPQRQEDERPAGKVVEIVKRGKLELVGELLAGHRLRPLNRKFQDDIRISGSLCGAKRGDWVKVKLLHGRGDAPEQRGIIREKIGRAGELQSDLDAICREFELPAPYSERDEKQAAALKPRQTERLDLRELFCVTIDPVDAKDFDDAISLRPTAKADEVEIGVHIADVAAWIAPNSKFDRMAFEHGFTAYLPGRTLPMLPKGLTKKISLTAGGDSLAHSVLMTVNRHTGKIVKWRRHHSVIRVKRRLTFDEVQQFIDGEEPSGWKPAFKQRIAELVAITRQMREWRRRHEHFLNMQTRETRVMVDEEQNRIIGLVHKVQREADQLVEECMLAANSAVAKELLQRGIPALFRVHDEPEPEKLAEFSEFVRSAFGLRTGDLSSRKQCNAFLQSLPDDPRKPIIISAFLRALPRAVYSEQPQLHFGLGKKDYSHFTSPIRRYSDLIVHQQLWAADNNEKLRNNVYMAKVGAACSSREQQIDEAYYNANDRIKLHYLKEQLNSGSDNLYEGMIARIIPDGMLVDIQELGIYGFVPRDSLRGNFRYIRAENRLLDRRGKRSFKIGDYIYLKLADIDFIRGSAIFRLPL